MFSQYLTYLLEKLNFIKVVIVRFFIILFRRRKRIEKIYLNYAKEHIFENSYIVINYRFRNAIYFRFGKNKTLEKQIKIFDLENIEKEFDLVVYGFFRKNIYKLKFEPLLSLENSTFKTVFSNLNLKLEEKSTPKLTHPDIYCDIKKPTVEIPNIEVNHRPLIISNTTFNQTDFI
ncbi:hypothetical protein [Flavobacterium sp. UBA7682]|uniref:hypothetical protein n=1 Tax=Flavobacterium sp. UBA7682 TaxID=1946560 RepID=UPI0025BE4944|nr:hypothetical protein [Flavobacterium sp. UBA7682]